MLKNRCPSPTFSPSCFLPCRIRIPFHLARRRGTHLSRRLCRLSWRLYLVLTLFHARNHLHIEVHSKICILLCRFSILLGNLHCSCLWVQSTFLCFIICTFAWKQTLFIKIANVLVLIIVTVFPGKCTINLSSFVEVSMKSVSITFLCTHSVEFVVLEESFIVHIPWKELSMTFSFVVEEGSLIKWTIFHDVNSVALSFSFLPLSQVYWTVLFNYFSMTLRTIFLDENKNT